MTTDLEELRKLAEAFGSEQWGYVEDDDTSTVLIVRAPNDAIVAETDDAERAKFIAAANPVTILALVSELEALREAVNAPPSLDEIDDAVRCIALGFKAAIVDSVNVGAALRRFVTGRLAALTKENSHV